MTKKTSDSNFGEVLSTVLTAWAKYPDIVRAVFYGSQEIGDTLRAALAPKPQSTVVSIPSNAQQSPSSLDETQEAFTPAPLWPLAENRLVGFVNGFFPVYDRRPGIFRL